MAKRKWLPAGILLLGIGLVGAFFLAAVRGAGAQSDTDNPETLREQAAAQEAESRPDSNRRSSPIFHTGIVSAPLFIGVDDLAVPAHVVDPDTGDAFPVFSGFDVWGAAYDSDNGRVLFNDGSTLYEWVPGIGVSTLGTITAPGGGSLVVVGLAYFNGSLYATRNIANEAVYLIDTSTLSATVYIDYVDADYDFGGFAIHPLTGDFYATNDDTMPFGSGLFRINLNGTATKIADYPPGETDIDGLAVSEGDRAYLVTDEPGVIHVFDFDLNDYVAPIPNPWTSAELFAGGGWIADLEGPNILLDKTVGTDPGICAPSDMIDVAPGTDVYYCYEVTNTGTITLSIHDLTDSELGTILDAFNFNLSPGASVFLTQTTNITETTINTATWTAYNPGPTDVAVSSDLATVNVKGPEIQLDKTVGTDPGVCASTESIQVPAGTDVTYCFEVTNLGLVTLNLHDVVDSELGQLLGPDFSFSLAPAASVFFTVTTQITQTTVNTATWTAYNAGPTDVASSSDTATVTVPPVIQVAPGALSTTLFPDQTAMLSLVISNTGDADLDWTIQERADQAATHANPGSGKSPQQGNVVQDGGFEAGTPNPFWNEFSSNFGTPICNAACGTGGGSGPHSGSFWAWFGGITGVSETGSVDQNVIIPAESAVLSFWLEIPVANTTGFLNVEIDGNVLATFTEADQSAYGTYAQVDLDVSAFADGGTHNLAFRSTTNAGGGALNFFVDDISLAGGCLPTDLPWVSASPATGSTPGGQSDTVNVTFDSTGLADGVYSGSLCIESNDPITPAVLVPLTLTVDLYEIFLPVVTRE